ETGKSTVAYALGQRGHGVWADDAVCFDTAREPIACLPLPFGLRLRPASAQFFDSRGLNRDFTGPGADPAPLAAIFILERAEAGVACQRLSPADAFPAVLAHGYYLTTEDRDRT